jgi:hypothetical protein
MGLTQADTTAISDGYHQTMLAAQRAVLAAGGFSWAWAEERQGAPGKGAVCRAFFANASLDFLYGAPLILGVARHCPAPDADAAGAALRGGGLSGHEGLGGGGGCGLAGYRRQRVSR